MAMDFGNNNTFNGNMISSGLLSLQQQLLQQQQQHFRLHQQRFLAPDPNRRPSEDDLFEMASMLMTSPSNDEIETNNLNHGGGGDYFSSSNTVNEQNAYSHSLLLKPQKTAFQKVDDGLFDEDELDSVLGGGNDSSGEGSANVGAMAVQDNNNYQHRPLPAPPSRMSSMTLLQHQQARAQSSSMSTISNTFQAQSVYENPPPTTQTRQFPPSMAPMSTTMSSQHLPTVSPENSEREVNTMTSTSRIKAKATKIPRIQKNKKKKVKKASTRRRPERNNGIDLFLPETTLEEMLMRNNKKRGRNYDMDDADRQDEWCLIDFGDDGDDDDYTNGGMLGNQRKPSFDDTFIGDLDFDLKDESKQKITKVSI